MHIGLYFGSFNPIHIGHLIIAEFVASNTDVQQVWFVVSPHNPLKSTGSLLNEYNRLHLVNLAIEDNAKLKASDVEFKLARPSYTIDTLTYLQEKYPTNKFSIILGSDSYQNLPKWKNPEILKRDYSFIIYQRPGSIVKPEPEVSATILDAPMLDISATQIRKFIKENTSTRYLLPEKVRAEIDANRYYKV
jgi:nicotinate-nucleotide adenylyltransferase